MLEMVRQLARTPEPHDYRAEAQGLIDRFADEAVNQALACQNTLLEAGEEDAALIVLKLLAEIWDIEDGRGGDAPV